MKIDDILAQERRARMAAERLLAQKQAELSDANKQLSLHARNLSEEIVETREDLNESRSENTLVRADLEKATKEVVIAKRRLWDSLETIEDGFAVFDQNDCMIAANTAYLKPFDGLECVAPGISYIEILHIALDEGIVDIGTMRPLNWRDMMLSRWRAPMIEPHTLRLWDGTYIKLVDRRSDDGDTVSMGMNITDTIKYEARLKEARVKAEAANRAKSAFLANMSHEIRTPMNGVVAIADLMAEGELDEEQMMFVQTIKKSGEALLTIINDVLDYSKIEAAKLTLHTQSFDLEAKIHDVVTLLLPSIQEKGLEISVDFDIFMPTKVIGDPVRIGQILTNLIGNAVKFTAEGHIQVRVLGLPVADGEKQKIHITIEDTGIGIPAEMQSHIFGEFNQVEDERNRRFDGTGLGLTITKQLIEMMNGEIWVESEEGKGACFGLYITLPVEEEVQIPKLPLGLRKAILFMDEGLQQDTLGNSLQALGLEVTSTKCADDIPTQFDQPQVIFAQDDLLSQTPPERVQQLATENACLVLLTRQNSANNDKLAEVCDISRSLMIPIPRQKLFEILQDIDFKRPISAPTSAPEPEEARLLNERPLPQDTLNAVAELVAAPNADGSGLVEDTGKTDQCDRPQSPFTTSRSPDEAHNIPSDPPAPTRSSVPVQEIEEPRPATPVIPAAPLAEATPVDTPPVAPETETELRQMRVLAAEDNRTNRLVFSKLIKALDIELRFANNGREALEMFQEFDPDLVFMDISMPEMDGKEATQRIRELEAAQGLEHTRIVALTAHAMAGDAEEILAYGLDKHLTKPLKKPLIIGEIQDNCPEEARPPLPEE